MAGKISANNGKKGGRPKGSLQPETILKIKTESAVRQHIFKMAKKLIDAQVITALGTHKMVIMTKDDEGVMHVETVRDEKHMNDLLETGVYGRDYLIVAGSAPDWKAANALLDRGYGKAKESLAVEVDVKFSLKGLAERRRELAQGSQTTLPDEQLPEDIISIASVSEPSEIFKGQ